MIKAIVFDMGGVIIDLNMTRCVNSFKVLGFGSITDVLDPCHQKGFFQDLECGAIGKEEFLAKCVACSAPGTTQQQCSDALMSFCQGVQPYKIELLRDLKKKYKLYCLSNNNPIVVERFNELCPGVKAEEFFDECFFSFELKMMKPNRDIFEYAISHIGLDPSEILFVDDSPLNTKAAAQLGMRTITYDLNSNLCKAVFDALY